MQSRWSKVIECLNGRRFRGVGWLKYLVYVVVSVVHGLTNLAITLIMSFIVISMYKVANSLTIDTMINAIEMLENKPFITSAVNWIVVCYVIRAISDIICRRLENKFGGR